MKDDFQERKKRINLKNREILGRKFSFNEIQFQYIWKIQFI